LGREKVIFMIKEYFKIAVRNLRTRPLRSWLTILGIVIGVFLITSLLSLSEGLKSTILKELKMIGKDIVIVVPGEANNFISSFLGGLKLSDEDIKTIEKTRGVEAIIPMVYKTEIVRYMGERKSVLISGIDWKDSLKIYQEDLGYSLKEGRWPVPGKREVVVGSLLPEDVFKDMKIGSKIGIKGREYEIVGILNSFGSKVDDSFIHLDIDIFRAITGERKGALQILAKVKPGFSTDEVAREIKANLLEVQKKKKGEDIPFSVLTNEKVSGIVNNIMGVVQFAVFSFASIAVIVGGIGIMNTMYTSVHERTREIGILKAVGAKRSIIVLIFLIESGIIGVMGGIGGMLPGLGLAKLIEAFGQVHPMFYLKAEISPFIILFALGFSFLIGCVSGFFPAKRAAALKPVDALRRFE